MAEFDPTLPKSSVEGPYALAKRERLLDTILPPIAPVADSLELSRLIQIRRSVLADLIDDAMLELDGLDGDADLEDATNVEDEGLTGFDICGRPTEGAPGCDVADPDGPSVAKWHTLGRFKASALSGSLPDEDAEQDDASEDDDADSCTALEDQGSAVGADDGCAGDADDAEQEHDAEVEQAPGDVPTLPVYAREPNIFTASVNILG